MCTSDEHITAIEFLKIIDQYPRGKNDNEKWIVKFALDMCGAEGAYQHMMQEM